MVAGGGPTGVELSGALAELFTKVLAKDFKNLDVNRAQVVLVEMTDHLLDGFSPQSQVEAKIELELRGVDVRLGVSIASVGEGLGEARRRHGDPGAHRDLGRGREGQPARPARSGWRRCRAARSSWGRT